MHVRNNSTDDGAQILTASFPSHLANVLQDQSTFCFDTFRLAKQCRSNPRMILELHGHGTLGTP